MASNKPSQKNTHVRSITADIVTNVLLHGHSLNVHTNDADALSVKDKALLQELCFGVCRYAPRLEKQTQTLLSKPMKSKDFDIYALILIGLYQLQFTRIPDHAAISSVVEAAKKRKKIWATKLINACLRRFQREETKLAAMFENDVAYQTAHPQWIVDLLKAAWPYQWKSILEQNNLAPPMTLRVNAMQSSLEDYQSTLHNIGITTTRGAHSDSALTLQNAKNVHELPSFDEGIASVQDEAAQLAARLIDPQANETILDACCAPGGKTCHLLEQSGNKANVIAIDNDEKRLARVQENLDRLKLHAKLQVADLSQPPSWWNKQPFDKILLDAPCSATGVIRRHPDIKSLRLADDIPRLAALQLSMLETLWPTLAAGGTLVYATCSVFPQENEHVIETFIDRTPDAEHHAITAGWGQERTYGRQLFPTNQGHDGFYYAKLIKAS